MKIKDVVKMPEPIKDFGTNDYERGESSGYNSAISKIGNMEISMLSSKDLFKACQEGHRDYIDAGMHGEMDLCWHITESISAKFPTVKLIKINKSEKFETYISEMVILYGEAFIAWCKQEGYKKFDEWADKQGLDFVKLPDTAKPVSYFCDCCKCDLSDFRLCPNCTPKTK